MFTGGVGRAILHWLTPCPGCGVGFWTFELPELHPQHALHARVEELKKAVGGVKQRLTSRATNNRL